jgi:hypothetical protein
LAIGGNLADDLDHLPAEILDIVPIEFGHRHAPSIGYAAHHTLATIVDASKEKAGPKTSP